MSEKMQKIAVDNATKDYWSKYFDEYGQMWVRDIPRRMKTAMSKEANVDKVEGNIAPMAAHRNKDGGLSIEAAFVGTINDQDAKILITAAFDSEGKMTEFVPNRIV